MKTYLCTILWLFLSCTTNKMLASDSALYQVIRLPQYYDEIGVIFYKDYQVPIAISNAKERYTPSVDDVQKAENVLIEKFNLIRNQQYNVKKYLSKYVRHYIGLINNSGEKNIIVQLIDNSKKAKVRRLLGKGWETDFQVVMNDEFYSIAQLFRINIDTGEISTQL